ncbi:MAG TPA: protein kinase [Terriglobia bacterium]|nr:protein kinase [Terriglobia bacterium]
MPLNPGTKLGPYEILAPLGAGGMGEVYKAADTRLNRTVAIKVLPRHFSEDREMKQRFEREAQTIAALNHPNICMLFDVGRQGDIDFLVMEHLEGETLAQRIERGPLPLDEALKVAVGIADALDKAHRKGVTHRDLKPGNIMLTAGGVKLLDFGLAKLKEQAQSDGSTPAPAGPNTTTPGTILGTMQYMAPEQLEGREADARTDIFAFGAILYEAISGKRAFMGKSQAHLIAAIVSADPEPLSKTQPMTPPALEFVVQRCLVKDPEQRVQTAWDLVCELQWIAQGGTEAGIPAPLAALRQRRARLARLAFAVAAVIAVIIAIPAFLQMRSTQTVLEARFLMMVSDMPVPEAAAIAPDGRRVAYSASDGRGTVLFVRSLNSETPLKLMGTEGAAGLFWSPDSRQIAFFANGKLRKVEATGGPPQDIANTPDMQGGTWSVEDIILFATSKGLMSVRAVGGDPQPVEVSQGLVPQSPYFLPDGEHYLFSSSKDEPAIYVGLLGSTESTRLVAARSNGVYADPGYLLYHREGTLYAHAFNPGRQALSGNAIRIADKVPYSTAGAAAFSASHTGTLIFRSTPEEITPGVTATAVPSLPLVWVDRSGRVLEQLAPAAGWAGVDISPTNANRIAAHRHDGNGGDVWIFEPGESTPAKFTFDSAQDNSTPVWTPDGRQVAFGSRRNGKWGIYIKLADNTRDEVLLLESDDPVAPMSWTPKGDALVYWAGSPKTLGDIWRLPIDGEKKPQPLLNTSADERHPQLSPDGRWLAYSSNETGRSEVYVRPYPEGTKIQISANGGVFPRWGVGSRELYFMNLVSAGDLMVSEIRVDGASIQKRDPRVMFSSGFFTSAHSGGPYPAYAVSPDGRRFLIPQIASPVTIFTGRGSVVGIDPSAVIADVAADRHASSSPAASPYAPINVVLNWTTSLNKD